MNHAPALHRVPRDRGVRVALLGCGTVGRKVAHELFARRLGAGVDLCRVLVRDATRDRGLPAGLVTDRFEDVLASEPDVVIEALGGREPAREHVWRLLAAGAHVVSANKTLIAHHGEELGGLARARGVRLRYEASVCAGVPVLAAIAQLRGDRVWSIRGVVNGSCNFILSRLEEGWTFASALEEARRRGLVEPDPSADISGRDSVEKMCVLASAAGLGELRPGDVSARGIEGVTPEDLRSARRDARTIKLIAEIEVDGDRIRARVGPTLVPRGHELAGVADEENGVVIEAELAGRVFLRGRGAGPGPTASAILGDVAAIVGSLEGAEGSAAPGGSVGAAGAIGPSPRAQVIRVRSNAGSLSPQRVLGVAREHGIEPHEADLHGAIARLLTPETDEAAAWGLARALAGSGEALVLPVLRT
jgi:homoserine dehydrogenase